MVVELAGHIDNIAYKPSPSDQTFVLVVNIKPRQRANKLKNNLPMKYHIDNRSMRQDEIQHTRLTLDLTFGHPQIELSSHPLDTTLISYDINRLGVVADT